MCGTWPASPITCSGQPSLVLASAAKPSGTKWSCLPHTSATGTAIRRSSVSGICLVPVRDELPHRPLDVRDRRTLSGVRAEGMSTSPGSAAVPARSRGRPSDRTAPRWARSDAARTGPPPRGVPAASGRGRPRARRRRPAAQEPPCATAKRAASAADQRVRDQRRRLLARLPEQCGDHPRRPRCRRPGHWIRTRPGRARRGRSRGGARRGGLITGAQYAPPHSIPPWSRMSGGPSPASNTVVPTPASRTVFR